MIITDASAWYSQLSVQVFRAASSRGLVGTHLIWTGYKRTDFAKSLPSRKSNSCSNSYWYIDGGRLKQNCDKTEVSQRWCPVSQARYHQSSVGDQAGDDKRCRIDIQGRVVRNRYCTKYTRMEGARGLMYPT